MFISIPYSTNARGKWAKYVLITLCIGGLVSLTGFITQTTIKNIFLINMGIFMILEWSFWSVIRMQVKLMENYFNSLFLISFWSFILIVIGYLISFFLLTKYFDQYFIDRSLMWVLSFSSLAAFIPMLTQFTFESAIAIPPADYKKWIHPDKTLVMDMENIDLSNFAVITFVFAKKFGEKATSNFQSKAPYTIKLGDLFYFFIQEWNYKNPGNIIEYTDENGMPHGWYFTIKKSWWRRKTYLDPDLSIRENNIRLNELITTERVSL